MKNFVVLFAVLMFVSFDTIAQRRWDATGPSRVFPETRPTVNVTVTDGVLKVVKVSKGFENNGDAYTQTYNWTGALRELISANISPKDNFNYFGVKIPCLQGLKSASISNYGPLVQNYLNDSIYVSYPDMGLATEAAAKIKALIEDAMKPKPVATATGADKTTTGGKTVAAGKTGTVKTSSARVRAGPRNF